MHATLALRNPDKPTIELSPDSSLQIQVDGQLLELDAQASVFMLDLLREHLAGRVITATSDNTFLTTQEAAEFMGISRPTLIKLLDEHKTPVQSTGSHRRIRFSDILILEDQVRDKREQFFKELVELSEAVGMYELDLEKNPFVKD